MVECCQFIIGKRKEMLEKCSPAEYSELVER